MIIIVPISTGELIDKLTILDIKLRKLKDTTYVQYEYDNLFKIFDYTGLTKEIVKYDELLKVNEKIWDLEEQIRKDPSELPGGDLGYPDDLCIWAQVAREIYKNNDLRAKLKKEINLLTQSQIVEQKSYDWFKDD